VQERPRACRSPAIFNLFAKRPASDCHRLAGEIVEPLFADIGARDSDMTRHMKCEVLRAWLEIAVYITAPNAA
jgi:hypothetical protein